MKTVDEELKKIKTELVAVLKEDCNDSDACEFIKLKAVVLKTRIHNLKEKIRLDMESDKKFKMAYQKLYNSLDHIETSVKYIMPLDSKPEHIKHQIELIISVKDEIEGL
jgi:hypothetical protein